MYINLDIIINLGTILIFFISYTISRNGKYYLDIILFLYISNIVLAVIKNFEEVTICDIWVLWSWMY
jgi:hypothetical protein